MNRETDKTEEVVYHSNPHHSQDRWVIESIFRGKRGGFFIEAGASEGSNTQTLERIYGWSGLAVEPHPELFKEVEKERNCILENVCLTDSECEVDFVLNDDIPGTSTIANMSQKLNEIFYQPGGNYRTIKVDGYPLWTLLEKHDAPEVIDYLSLDIEGAEWLALKDFPFDKYSFRCMTIERGADEYSRLRALLLDKGYKLVKIAKTDDYWLHPSIDYRAPVSDRLYVVLRSWLDLHPSLLRPAQRVRNLFRTG